MFVLHFTEKEIKVALCQRAMFLIGLIMPLVMILFMATALSSAFDGRGDGWDKIPVLYYDGDQGQVSRALEEYLRAQAILQLEEADRATIDGAIARNQYPAAVMVPEGLSGAIHEGRAVSVEVIRAREEPIKGSIVGMMVEGFVSSANTAAATVEALRGVVPAEGAAELARREILEVARGVGTSFVVKGTLNTGNKHLTAYQYFSASMLIFFLLAAGMAVATSIIKEREDRTFIRLKALPVHQSDFLWGKILGNGLISLLQAGVVVGFTALVLGVDWGDSLPGLAAVILLTVFVSSGIGVLAAALLDSAKAVAALVSSVLWLMTLMSGGFVALPGMDRLGLFTLNKWGFDALTGLMSGKGMAGIVTELAVMTSLGIALMAAALLLYNRRVAHE